MTPSACPGSAFDARTMVNDGGDSTTVYGTVPVPRGPRMRPRSCEQTPNCRLTPSRTVGDLVWAWPTPQIHGACSSWLPMLASDFGEEHETQAAFARTSPHRTDPACVM